MPSGNVNTTERIIRLKEIKQLQDEGKSNTEIAEELGMSLSTVSRNVKHLKDLNVADLTPEDLAKKRTEIELEFDEIIAHAKEQFEEWIEEKPSVARSFLISWMNVAVEKAKLYGLNVQKVDSFNQFNQLNQYEVRDKISVRSGEKLAEMIKRDHEERQ